MKKLLALSAVGVLAFAACGDDDDDGGSDTTDIVTEESEVTEESVVTEESEVEETTVESVVTEESSGHRGERRRGNRSLSANAAAGLTRSTLLEIADSRATRESAVLRVWAQPTNRRAISFRQRVSSAPSKIDRTRASR